MRKAIVFGTLALLAPILCAQRQETGLVIQSWKYDPETKDLTLTLVNVSGKDIIAYNISNSDGSTDLYRRPRSPGEHLEDSLGLLIIEQMTGKKPRLSRHIRLWRNPYAASWGQGHLSQGRG